VRLGALIGVALAGLVATGCGTSSDKGATSVVTVTKTIAAAGSPAPAARGSTADVVARVLPGVVNVKTVGLDGSKGEASGVVIDRHGVIVTNNHVVRGARSLTVSFNDGRHEHAVPARVLGTAASRDLAIIRVELDDLIPVPLGRSSKLRLGDSVLAIGFPLDLGGGPTVTEGIVSGLDRTVHADDGPDLQGLLQTDAAINPGNSGGALVNAAGRLIGINTIAATGAENIGFAIAIDGARPVIDELRGKPAGSQAWIGATFDSVASSADAVQLGLQPETRGAAVVAVFSATPASRAGLQEGDVVVAVGGKAVRSAADMDKAVASHEPGDSLVLDVVDQSGPRRAGVKLVRRPTR
jgi:S1-C subfamily serine protease